MADVAGKLFNQIRGQVYAAQVGKLHSLKGKYVERDGVVFLVTKVDWQGGRVTVSDTKTPLKQTTVFNVKSFLSKAITPVKEVDEDGK